MHVVMRSKTCQFNSNLYQILTDSDKSCSFYPLGNSSRIQSKTFFHFAFVVSLPVRVTRISNNELLKNMATGLFSLSVNAVFR